MVQVSCSFAPDAGTGRPSHACQHAQPSPDPVSRHVHLMLILLRSHGNAVKLVLSVPGRASVPFSASSSAWKALRRPQVRLCLLVRSRACVLLC